MHISQLCIHFPCDTGTLQSDEVPLTDSAQSSSGTTLANFSHARVGDLLKPEQFFQECKQKQLNKLSSKLVH